MPLSVVTSRKSPLPVFWNKRKCLIVQGNKCDVGIAVVVEIAKIQAHAGDEAAIFGERDAGLEGNFLELVSQVMEERVVERRRW